MTDADPSLAEDRTSPLGLWMYADSYLDAATCVIAHSRHPHREPVYLLYAHAVEVRVKGVPPIEKGVSIEEIRSSTISAVGAGRCLPRAVALWSPAISARRWACGGRSFGDRRYRRALCRRPGSSAARICHLHARLFTEWLIAETKALCVPRGPVRPPSLKAG